MPNSKSLPEALLPVLHTRRTAVGDCDEGGYDSPAVDVSLTTGALVGSSHAECVRHNIRRTRLVGARRPTIDKVHGSLTRRHSA